MTVEAHVGSPNRPPYRRYVRRRLGQIGVATEKLDKRIRSLSTSIHLNDMSYSDVRETLQPHIDSANEVLESVSPLDNKTDPTSWFRLKGHVQFAPELALAPHVFATNDMERRTELANGTSGLAVDVIANAMDLLYTSFGTTPAVRGELKGAINEYTYLAVMNYPQDGQVLALPGSQKADLFHKTDSVLYGTDADNNHYQTSIQIKTDPLSYVPPYRDHVITVTASEFGNTPRENGGLKMSRLLVNEYEGGNRGHARNRKQILMASQALKNSVLYRQNVFNTVHMN